MDRQLFMKRCLELALQGRGKVAPNPMVGALLEYRGQIIAEGFHAAYGSAHAEVNCFDAVPPERRHLIPDSTLYVSLEPCAHYGKTPPCALRIVKERPKKVIVCNEDPFPAVDGKGLQIVEGAGIETETGLLADQGLWLNRRFFCFHTLHRPYIILKWAQTREGFFAPVNRTRHQMSNSHSLQLLHRWRTEESAIMVGTKTAASDNPQLTARLWEGRQPLRIVIDRKLALDGDLRIFDGSANTWILNEIKNGSVEKNTFLQLDFSNPITGQLMHHLRQEGVQSLMVEGGADLLQRFIADGLWDEARIFETAHSLDEGVAAPQLSKAVHAFSADIGTDRLHVYTHRDSRFPYVQEMEL